MKSASKTPPKAAKSGPAEKSADIKKLAQSHAPEALLAMVRLMDSKDEKVVLAAAREVLLRACGKPDQAVDEEGAGIIVIRENLPDCDDQVLG
ncbi:hypothetical protein C4J81_11575 [Deltaproteobacteria bacterium Smac51]|nr:hypothetical protein C4J81_11575 [Deltaproteobacteria bacterium Smac51]